jgi:hypothetical protein
VLEAEHEKEEMLFDSEWGWKFGTGEVDFEARGHGPGWRTTPQGITSGYLSAENDYKEAEIGFNPERAPKCVAS